jgi:hypothetical protein
MKIKRLRSMAFGLGLASFSVLTPVAAHAQQKEAAPAAADDKKVVEAKSRYKAGLSLYDDGAYEAARVQFERAYQLAPTYKILYNVGLVYKHTNEFVGALKSFEQYLQEGGSEIPEDRRAEVNKLIASIKPIIASVTVTTNVPDAEIMVDDAVVAKSPSSVPILLNPGSRKIGAKKAGRIPDTKVITVASGDTPTVDLTLGESVVVQQGTNIKPIIAWAVTGGLAIGAGVTGFLANNASNEREDLLAKRELTKSEIDKAVDKQQTLSLVSDVLSIATIVSAGVAVYFTWFAKKPEKGPVPSDDEKKAASSVRIIPGVGSLLVKF